MRIFIKWDNETIYQSDVRADDERYYLSLDIETIIRISYYRYKITKINKYICIGDNEVYQYDIEFEVKPLD